MAYSCDNLDTAWSFLHWREGSLTPIPASIVFGCDIPEGADLVGLKDPLAITGLLELQYFLHIFALPVSEVSYDHLGCRVVQFTSGGCLASTHSYFFDRHRTEVEVVQEVSLESWGNLGVFTVLKVIIHRPGL